MPAVYRISALASLMAIAAETDVEAAISITKAKIDRGRLIVEGKSNTGTQIKLDDSFTTRINSKDIFKFSLTYLPADCIVDLQVVGSATRAKAVVANCGPKDLRPMGAWLADRLYLENDLVTHEGSTWRALPTAEPNINQNPLLTDAYWEKFASKGDSGLDGQPGPEGPQGESGPQGLAGAQGVIGPQGPQGSAGAQGPQGAKGLNARGAWSSGTTYAENDIVTEGGSAWRAIANALPNLNKTPASNPSFWEQFAARGTQGAQGPQGTQGPQGSAGSQGPQGLQGSAGSQGLQGAQGASGAAGATGSTGATGAQGPSGIVTSGYTFNQVIFTAGDTDTFAFLGNHLTLNVSSNQTVLIDAVANLGTSQSGGAQILALATCYRPLGTTTLSEPGSDFLFAIQYPPGARYPLSVTGRFTGLAPGTYDFGVCYRSSPGQVANWDLKDWMRLRVVLANSP